MSRPAVSVVMPFAGNPAAAGAAVSALLSLRTVPGDELILADNSGHLINREDITVVLAGGEHSPAHARNVGAGRARNEWLLFLDADCVAPAGLLDAYFSADIEEEVGALAGAVVPVSDGETLAARYGASRNPLSQQAHLRHRFRPRAAAANLLVRRAAFEQVGGFFEGVRAGEDTDFSWRLQQAGWRLELRSQAQVEHRYRTSLRELRRQWRGYAAGRAWLGRRYESFTPEPAIKRALRRGMGKRGPRDSERDRRSTSATGDRLERGRFLAIDALLSADELAGLALSNKPRGRRDSDAQVVLVAERFPGRGDPLVEFARALEGARVEAVARPQVPDVQIGRELQIDYREDDGAAARTLAVLTLVIRHPVRSVLDALRRRAGEPRLSAIAPAVRRLERGRGARVQAIGGPDIHATALRIARLGGRPLAQAHPRPLKSPAEHAARR